MSAAESMSGQREALAVDSLRRGNLLRMQVRGESMLPTLWPGDEVSVVPGALDEVRPGDLILAIREGRLFLHRFVALTDDGGFVARGDSVSQADLPYPRNAFLGKVVTVNRDGETAVPPASFGLSRRLLGLSLCHIGPLRRIALSIHKSRRAKHSQAHETAEVL